jgi:hypothetical protein
VISILNRYDTEVQVSGKGTLGGKLFIGANHALQDIIADTLVEELIARHFAACIHIIGQHAARSFLLQKTACIAADCGGEN